MIIQRKKDQKKLWTHFASTYAYNVNKIYDKRYEFDNPNAVTDNTEVVFEVARDRDGRISITVSSDGQHKESHYIDTVHPSVSDKVREQIIKTINLMDEEQSGANDLKKL